MTQTRESEVWLTIVHRDGYRTFDVGPFDSADDARLMLDKDPNVGSASISREGIELDYWTPARGWDAED